MKTLKILTLILIAAQLPAQDFWVDKFKSKNIPYPPTSIAIEVSKYPSCFSVWAYSANTNRYEFVVDYPVYFSGDFGPKRTRGDRQVPEGLYEVILFNPKSKFIKSMKINYPNESDKILGSKDNLGGDIFIHGGRASIGCLAIDNNINDFYRLAKSVSKVYVFIFPWTMSEWAINKVSAKIDAELLTFWKNLQLVYAYWTTKRQIPKYTVSTSGLYCLE